MLQPPYVRRFVGREYEQDLYQQFLTDITPWVMILTGQAGIGKSTLLRHLAEHTPHDVLILSLDFAKLSLLSDPLIILEELALQMASYCDTEKVEEFKQALYIGRNELTRLSEQLTQGIASIDSTGGRESHQSIREFEARGIREIHLHTRKLVAKVFYDQVDTFNMGRLVLLLDTCERLTEPQNLEIGQWVIDELIPEFHLRTQRKQRQCSVVIASRLPLSFEVIRRKDQVHLVVPMLNEEGVDQYLEHIGMQDTQLRQHVYAITYGHPLCLSIIGTLWQERGEQPFTLGDLPKLTGDFNERALLEFIQERMDVQLASPFRELTHYGVLLRSFNLSLLQAVFPEFLPDSEAFECFHQFIQYPYIESFDNHRYAFHDLLREILAPHIREYEPEAWKNYHKRALDYLSQTAPRSTDWYYHALAYDEEKAMPNWLQAWQTAQVRGIRGQLDTLLQAAYDVTLNLSPLASARRTHLQGYFYYHDMQIDAALQAYKQALIIYQQVGDRSGEAYVLQAIGDVQQFRKEMQAALASYLHALSLYQQVEDRLGEANVRKAIGDVQQFHDEYDAALASYLHALSLYQQVEDRLGEANVRKAIGDVQPFHKDMAMALQSYEQALGLYRQLGNRLGEANVLQAIGDIQLFHKDMAMALQSYEQALGLYRQLGNRLGEANVLQAIGDIQLFHKDMAMALQSYEQALGLYRQLGNRLGEANVLQAIGDIQCFRDEPLAALASYEQALTLFRQVGDRLGEANVLQAKGDVQQLLYQQESALASYKQALSLFRQVDSRLGEANVLQAIGGVQQRRDEQREALASYERALTLFHEIGDNLGEANCYLAQGQVAFEQEKYQEALTLQTRAYEIYQQINDLYSQGRLLYYRSHVYEAMGDQQLAMQDIEGALSIAHQLQLPFVDLFQQRFDTLTAITS